MTAMAATSVVAALVVNGNNYNDGGLVGHERGSVTHHVMEVWPVASQNENDRERERELSGDKEGLGIQVGERERNGRVFKTFWWRENDKKGLVEVNL